MVSSRGLRFTAKVFAPVCSEKQDYCGTKIEIPVKTGDRNGKYRNPEDSCRNMQPSTQADVPTMRALFGTWAHFNNVRLIDLQPYRNAQQD